MTDSQSRPHEDLDVWQKSMQLVSEIYEFTSSFPSEEKYGLTSQLRRSAVSVPSNIAEGAARQSEQEFIKHLYISSGSLSELETLVLIAENLDYTDSETTSKFKQTVGDIASMLNGLINHLEEK